MAFSLNKKATASKTTELWKVEHITTNEVVNSLGAGNALISAFIHYYLETKDSVNAIKNGLLYASYKTGFMRTCEGFLTPEQVEQWRDLVWKTQPITDIYGIDINES